MKRKYDEGYALPFALVVLLFLSIVAISMMDLTYQDLKAQQDSIARMQEQYIAQGILEKVVAELETVTTPEEIAEICNRYNEGTGESEVPPLSYSDYQIEVRLLHSGGKYNVSIECKLNLTQVNTGLPYKVTYETYSIECTKQEVSS